MADSIGAITAFDKTVPSAGTAVALHSAQRVSSITIKAKVANATNIFIGGPDLEKDTPPNAGLPPGEALSFNAIPGQKFDIGNIYLDTATNNDGVDCWYVP